MHGLEKESVDRAVGLARRRAELYLMSEEGRQHLVEERGRRGRIAKEREMEKERERERGEMGEEGMAQEQLYIVKAVFDSFDVDGSGSIDSEVVSLVLGELGIVLSVEKVEEGVDDMDEDGSGEIWFNDFYDWFVGKQREGEEEEEEAGAENMSVRKSKSKAKSARRKSGSRKSGSRKSGSRKSNNNNNNNKFALSSFPPGLISSPTFLSRAVLTAVQLNFTRPARLSAQAFFRNATAPKSQPRFSCLHCRRAVPLYREYLKHFGKSEGGGG